MRMGGRMGMRMEDGDEDGEEDEEEDEEDEEEEGIKDVDGNSKISISDDEKMKTVLVVWDLHPGQNHLVEVHHESTVQPHPLLQHHDPNLHLWSVPWM